MGEVDSINEMLDVSTEFVRCAALAIVREALSCCIRNPVVLRIADEQSDCLLLLEKVVHLLNEKHEREVGKLLLSNHPGRLQPNPDLEDCRRIENREQLLKDTDAFSDIRPGLEVLRSVAQG